MDPDEFFVSQEIKKLEDKRHELIRELEEYEKRLLFSHSRLKGKEKRLRHEKAAQRAIAHTRQRIVLIEEALQNKEDIWDNRFEEGYKLDYLKWYEKDAQIYDVPQGDKPKEEKMYDLFISHATADKEDFVRPLAKAFRKQGLKVWYDEFELKLGDSLREKIDFGVKSSKCGLVVLSTSFFNRSWTDYELNSFVAREMSSESKVILPIWHKVSKDEVMSFSASLADKVALKSSDYNLQEIAVLISEIVRDL